MKIVVIGGTGLIGSKTIPILRVAAYADKKRGFLKKRSSL